MTAELLFMGEQADAELEVWRGRGLRVYGGTEPRREPVEPEQFVPPPLAPLSRALLVNWHTCAECLHGHTRAGSCAFRPGGLP